MMRAVRWGALALLLAATAALADITGGGGPGLVNILYNFVAGYTVPASVYYANNPAYGNCTWSTAAGADVGPCIQAAITAAATAGGGNVILPAGNFNLATQLTVGVQGVHITGGGGSTAITVEVRA